MRRRTLLGAASALALAGASIYLLRRNDDENMPPTMTRVGEATNNGIIIKQRTIDYETIVRSALSEKAALIAVTLKADVTRNQHLESSIRFTPLPKSRATVRVKYHVEYAIGFPLEPGDFSVQREADALVVRVRHPQLVARPSVRLLSYDVLESGILVDEKTAVIELQRRIQPEAERRARKLLTRPGVSVRGERVLRRFLQGVIDGAADPGAKPPPKVVIQYR